MSESVKSWEVIESKEIADCRVFKVREDLAQNSDKKGRFYILETPDWVNVIALTRKREVVLIEQFRHGVGDIILEIPGGMIDNEEPPESAARRELAEETGYTAAEWILLGESRPNPAIQNNRIFHFLAIGAEKTGEPEFDEHESVATKLVELDDVSELILTGRISHSLVVTAFQFYFLQESNIKK